MSALRRSSAALLRCLRRHRELGGNGPLLCAVSLGNDSLALTATLVFLRQRARRPMSAFAIAHIDHGQHEQSASVAARSVALAAELGVRAHVTALALPSGASDGKSLAIVSGNEPPVVAVKIEGNQTYFFPDQPLNYSVEVVDREDGSLSTGSIPRERVNLSIDYVPEGFDVASLKGLPRGEEVAARFPVAQALITKGNCKACHLVEGKLVGPSFAEVARKYVSDPAAPARLAQKVVTGGGGVWSPLAMPPNALINEAEAATILKYILGLADTGATPLTLSGSFTPKLPQGDTGRGSILVRAVYTDQGEEQATPLTGESLKILRSPTLNPTQAEIKESTEAGGRGLFVKQGSVVGFRNIDLNGVKSLEIMANAVVRDSQSGGQIQVRMDSAMGDVLGEGTVEPRDPEAARSGSGAARADAPPAAAGANRGDKRPKPIHVKLREVAGKHDLYLLFKNDLAKEGTRLMTVSAVRLSREHGASSAGAQ